MKSKKRNTFIKKRNFYLFAWVSHIVLFPLFWLFTMVFFKLWIMYVTIFLFMTGLFFLFKLVKYDRIYNGLD